MGSKIESNEGSIYSKIGESILRVEDQALLTGQGQYTADIEVDNVLHMAFLRSIYAHAMIRSIDKKLVENFDGVIAAMDGREIAQEFSITIPLIGEIGDSYFDVNIPKRYLLSMEEACFVGDPIALVLAETEYIAFDLLEAITVGYDPLPASINAENASIGSEPRAHESLPNNIAFRWQFETGDVDLALRTADLVLEQRLIYQRVIPSALEPRAVLAKYDPNADHLTVWISTQIPHQYQSLISRSLEIPSERVQVISPNVGGGFGSKSNFYQEDLLACLLARKFGRPVRWVASRIEDIMATSHGRDQICDIRLAADKNGKIIGIEARIITDCGAYGSSWSPFVSPVTGRMITGAYDIKSCRASVVGVYTNKTPTEPYRGAGQPEAAYFIERSIDILARKINRDPAEVRRINFISKEAFPYRSAGGFTYDSGNYIRAFNRALEIVGYSGIREQQTEWRKSDEYLLGIGISSYIALGGPGPWEYGEVTITSEGRAIVFSGTAPQGQGHLTAWAQIVADVLQMPLSKVDVFCGDTSLVESGIGTYGSRSASVGGSAIYENAKIVRQNAIHIAAKLLETSVENVILENGLFALREMPSQQVSWPQIASLANVPMNTGEYEYALTSRKPYTPNGFTAAFGTHVCVIKIEKETGHTSIIRYITVDDCGKVINPTIVNGQIQGGIAQGIGQALWEHAIYDDDGNLLSGSPMDYLVPTALNLPVFEINRTETPSPLNPLGVKGVGEAAAIGSTPAVANAVMDALRMYGISHLDLPLTPEKIWTAIASSR